MKIIVSAVLLAILSSAGVAAYGEEEGMLQIDIKSSGGERPTHHGIVLKIYQDANETATKILPTSNPYEIALPLNHRYKIEAYASGMFVDVDFVELSRQNRVDLNMPTPGSVRFTTLYSDGYTPVEDALVSLRSNDGSYRYWTNSTTDAAGNTIRFWLQPTIAKGDHYVVDIILGDGLIHTHFPITVSQGLSTDVKITTPWPKAIDQLIVVSVIDADIGKISGLDRDIMVELYDEHGDQIQSSRVNHRGDAYFSNLKVGTYLLRAVDLRLPEVKELGSTKVTLSGKTGPLEIMANTQKIQNGTEQIPDVPTDISADPPESADTATEPAPNVPSWIKSVADWWARGQISDTEFLEAIEYLVNHRIITVQHLQTG
ncbi:MSCRAMM family protein [Candidatus Nitrosotenuis cloacae]|uniref:MSCRAMM family protein n=1 Tax=Candidatus Nitrosotenuis cloacae TaxID=1603555 RepID=UPI0022811799|nr:hypothetical protein [Candidatus Nitrosotenuis cloacae]